MDPEVTRELEEQLRTLNEMISQQTAAITGMSRAINESSIAVKNVGNNANQLTKSKKDSEQGYTRNTTANTALQKAHEKYGNVMEDVAANFSAAYQTGTTALFGFAQAVLGTQEGFAKYNSTIGNLGDTAFSVGKNFGVLGFIVGGLFKVGSEVLQYQTQQADGLLNATDAMARMGAAGTLTTEQVRQMGKGAGLTSLELEKLTKPMQSVQGGFMALGGTQSEGIKKFGEMVAVSEDVRREFKRLGMGDQERNQALADFVTMMNKSGMAASGSLSTQGGLQKAALAYTRNLYELSEMTGKDIETAKKERENQMATMEVALQRNKWESDRINAQRKLETATTEDERARAQADLERIAREEANFEQFNNELAQAGLSQDQITAAQNQYLTGTINRTSSQFAMWGVDMGEMIRKNKEGTLAKGELAQAIKEGFQGTLTTMGPATFALAPESAEVMGVNKELVGRTTQMADIDYRQQAAQASANVRANQEGTGAAAQDPALEARNDLTEAERKLKLKIDDLAAQFNFLLGNTEILKALGVAAAAAGGVLALLAGAALIKGGVSGLGSMARRVGGLFSRNRGGRGGAVSEASLGGIGAGASGANAAAGASDDLQKVAGGGTGIEGFLRGVTVGLDFAGKNATNVMKGGAAIAGTIGIIGGGIAGATWILGKTLPTLAEGLTAFNKVPGDNLKAVGIGMAGLGAGMLAMGGGKVLSSLGNLIDFFAGEEKDPLDEVAQQVLKMQGFSFKPDKIKANSDALISFSVAMAKVSSLGAVSGIGTMAKGIAEGITAYFEGKPPYQDFTEFSNLDIDEKKTKSNAIAFKEFAQALASFEGNGSSLGAIGQSIAEATARFFEVNPPFEQFVYFSKLNINPKRTKQNATAFKYFSEAMSSYKGLGSGLGAITTALADATAKFFGVKPPLEQFVYFSNLNINEKKANINAKAFVKFSNAMASYSGGPGLIDAISTFAGAKFGELFGQDGPMSAFEKFANKDFGPRAAANADAFMKYAQGVVAARQNNQAAANPSAPASGGASGTPASDVSSSGGTTAAPVNQNTAKAQEYSKKAIDAAKNSKEARAAGNTQLADTWLKASQDYAKASRGYADRFKEASASTGGTPVTPPPPEGETGEGSSKETYTVNGKIVSKRDYDTYMAAHPELAKVSKGQVALAALTGGTGMITTENLAKFKMAGVDIDSIAKTAKILSDNPAGTNPESKMPGSEIKAPLNTNSVLMKLAKTTEDEVKAATQLATAKTKHNTSSGMSEQGAMNLELYNMISSKVTTMLNILEDTNDNASRRLRAART